MYFVLFLFHEGQARLQLLVPPLPALGCAAISLLEETRSFLARFTWNISGLRDTSSGTQGHTDRVGNLCSCPKYLAVLWFAIMEWKHTEEKSKSHLAEPPDLSWPQSAHFQNGKFPER